MDELDEYDECKVQVGISGQWSWGERHPKVCHAASNIVVCVAFYKESDRIQGQTKNSQDFF